MHLLGVLVDGLGLAILAVLLLKCIAIFNAIAWLRREGSAYSVGLLEAMGRINAATLQNELLLLYRVHGGRFLPFGIKDHVLTEYATDLVRHGGVRGRIVGPALHVFRRHFFRTGKLHRLGILYIVATGLACATISPATLQIGSTQLRSVVTIFQALALTLGVMNVLMIVEFAVGSVFMNDYVTNFHILDHGRIGSAAREGLAFSIGYIVRITGRMLSWAVAAVFVSALLMPSGGRGGFESFTPHAHVPLDLAPASLLAGVLLTLLKSVYLVSTTISTVGYGDITPKTGWEMLVVIMLHVQMFILFTGSIAIFFSTRELP